MLATLPASPTVLAVDCTTLYVAPYEIGVVTAVSLADGSQRTLNPISANSLAMDSTRIYSVSPGGGNEPQGLVIDCPKTGCVPSYTTLAMGQPAVWGVAVDDSYVYWTNQGPPSPVCRAPLSGGPVENLGTPGDSADNIVVSAGRVFYAGGQGLTSVPTTGGTATVLYGAPGAQAVAADGVNVYFTTSDGMVAQIPVAGGAVTTLATGQANPVLLGLTVSATNVYWAASADGTIVTAPIGGGAVTTLATGQPGPTGIAVDANYVYWSNMGDNTIMKLALGK